MPSELKRIRKRNETRNELEELFDKSEHVLIIHYSCESFYDIKDGRTPRVTSIAARNLKTAQTESFSIHKIAERRRVTIKDIPSKYDDLGPVHTNFDASAGGYFRSQQGGSCAV